MKLVTRDTDYAVRALCFMARDRKKIISVAELVERLEVPRPFLRKILQTLNKKAILSSFKGQAGGFRLARPPKDIFVIDLMRIFQGPVKLNECVLKKNICPDIKRCPLRKKLDGMERFLISELKFITIASLLGQTR